MPKVEDNKPAQSNVSAAATKKLKLIAAVASVVAVASCYFANQPTSDERKQAAANLKPEATAYGQKFQEIATQCENAELKATASTTQSDTVAEYDAFTGAKDTCRFASAAAQVLKAPSGAKGETKKAFDEASSDCSYALGLKSDTYAALAKVLNGDTSPAAQSSARSLGDDANEHMTKCTNSVIAAVEGAGGAATRLKN